MKAGCPYPLLTVSSAMTPCRGVSVAHLTVVHLTVVPRSPPARGSQDSARSYWSGLMPRDRRLSHCVRKGRECTVGLTADRESGGGTPSPRGRPPRPARCLREQLAARSERCRHLPAALTGRKPVLTANPKLSP